MTKVNHRNIVQLIGVTWQETSDLCVVMELVKGTDMGKYIAFHKRQQFPRGFNAEKILMALQIADALAYLHGQSPPVIHRDLKPTNVLLTDRNQVKLADFGVTRENNGTLMTSQVGTTK
jgi:serine/threonine protein kinase